jgi:CheY-like chemotaxis protein
MAKILCIDDEAAIRKLIAEELRDAGHELIEAADGEIGLALIQQHRPDLVLCDISMPRLDGYQVLERTRALGPEFRLMPFLFLSAMAEPRQVIAGKRLGADDYITKPIEFDDFLAVINRRLRC